MKEITIYIFFLLFGYCVTVNFTCPKERPFVWKDNECGSFTEICIKSGLDECDFGRRACQQCPLASLSATKIDEMLTTIYTAKGKNGTIPEVIRERRATKGFLWIILIIVLFLLIFSILILLQIIRIGQRKKVKRDSSISPPTPTYSISKDTVKQILENQENPFNRKLEKISDTIGVSIWVKLPEFNKSMKLIVHQNDNIVTIKRKLCAKLVNTKKIDDFKMMQFQYNGELLDDNQCLPNIVSVESNAFHCIMNEELKSSTTILQLQGNIYVPEMIQLEKCVDISQLKQIVNKENINLQNLFVIKGSKILEFNKTIEKCELVDNDLLKVIKRDRRIINVKPVFPERISYETLTLQIDIIEKVKDIKVKIMKEFISTNLESTDNIFLFYEGNYLKDDMFYFEFDTGKLEGFTYCYSTDVTPVLKNVPTFLEHGDFNKVYECLYQDTRVILRKSNSDLKQDQSLINELITFHETNSQPRFVQLLGIFRDESCLYVTLEKMSDNSIQQFMKNTIKTSESLIIKWSQQILEGLEFLHNRKIIHRNIKPSNILLNDGGNNAKISSFGLSKHLYGSKGTVENILFSKVEILRYMAPEMYLDRIYNFKSDVYSFGATLTEIVTGNVPYYQIEDDHNIFFEQIRISPPLVFSSENERLNNFVNRCIQPNYERRPFISELRYDNFLF